MVATILEAGSNGPESKSHLLYICIVCLKLFFTLRIPHSVLDNSKKSSVNGRPSAEIRCQQSLLSSILFTECLFQRGARFPFFAVAIRAFINDLVALPSNALICCRTKQLAIHRILCRYHNFP